LKVRFLPRSPSFNNLQLLQSTLRSIHRQANDFLVSLLHLARYDVTVLHRGTDVSVAHQLLLNRQAGARIKPSTIGVARPLHRREQRLHFSADPLDGLHVRTCDLQAKRSAHSGGQHVHAAFHRQRPCVRDASNVSAWYISVIKRS
jgi:hypothetical protein